MGIHENTYVLTYNLLLDIAANHIILSEAKASMAVIIAMHSKAYRTTLKSHVSIPARCLIIQSEKLYVAEQCCLFSLPYVQIPAIFYAIQ